MKHSETITKIAPALVKAISEMPPALMNAVNPFHKNKYADLGSMIETARPVLEKYDLALTQWPVSTENKIGVESILLHTSGEWFSETVYTPQEKEGGKSMAQAAGSAITYLRRYSLGAILGMYTEEDLDGNTGNQTEGNKNGNRGTSTGKRTTKADQTKAKIAAVKRGWSDYAKQVGLMESTDNKDELKTFLGVMKPYLDKLPKAEDLPALVKEGNEAMDNWRKALDEETSSE